jgi:hypothetical protein
MYSKFNVGNDEKAKIKKTLYLKNISTDKIQTECYCLPGVLGI